MLAPSVNLSAVDFDVLAGEDGALAIAYALGRSKASARARRRRSSPRGGKRRFASMSDFAARVDAKAPQQEGAGEFRRRRRL